MGEDVSYTTVHHYEGNDFVRSGLSVEGVVDRIEALLRNDVKEIHIMKVVHIWKDEN